MTATAKSRDYWKMLARHHPSASVWDAETTLTARGYESWVSAATTDSASAKVYATGAPESAVPLEVKVSRGGLPGRGAEFALSPDGSTWYGWDEPSTWSEWMPIDAYAGASHRNSAPAMATAGDGSLIYIGSKAPSVAASGAGGLEVFRRAAGSAWAPVGALTAVTGVDSLDDYPSGWGPCPAMALDADGRLYLAMLKNTRNGDIADTYVDSQVWVWEAGPDADWSSVPFELRARNVLADGAIRFSDSLDGPLAMALAIGGGQALLLVVSPVSGTVRQYAGPSVDRLERVDSSLTVNTSGRIAVEYVGSSFVVAYRKSADDDVMVIRLGDASYPLIDTEAIDTGMTCDDGGSPALAVDDAGRIYVLATTSSGSVRAKVARSSDGGSTWSAAEGVAPQTGSDGAWLARWWRGRMVVALETSAVVGYEHGAASFDLGGWTTNPMPPVPAAETEETQRLGRHSPYPWIPIALPQSPGRMVQTDTGTPSRAWTSDLDLEFTCGALDAVDIEYDPPTTYAVQRFLTARWCGEAVSGQTVHMLGDGTHELKIEHTSSGITAVDGSDLSTLGSASYGGTIEIRAWLDISTGDFAAVYRVVVPGSDLREYTALASGTLGSGSGYSLAKTRVANAVYRMRGLDASSTSGELDFAPDIPYGAPFGPSPWYADRGASVAARGAMLALGDTWGLYPYTRFGADRAAATATYCNLSQRLETSGTTAGYVAWTLGDDPQPAPPAWIVWVETNAETVEFSTHNGSTWSSNVTVKAARTFSASGGGHAFYADTGSGSTYWHEADELAGGWVKIGSQVLQIAGNTSGPLDRYKTTSGTQAIVRTQDGISSAFTGTSVTVVPPRSVAIVIPSTQSPFRLVQGFRLRLSGSAPPGGAWALKCIIGPAIVAGEPHGRDTRWTASYRRAVAEAPSGLRAHERFGRADERIELSWQDVPNIWQRFTRTWSGGTLEPDRLADANGNPVTLLGMTLYDIRSVWESGADGTPYVYVPSYSPADGTVQGYAHRCEGAFVGTIEDGWSTEHAGLGEEMRTDVQRGGVLILRALS